MPKTPFEIIDHYLKKFEKAKLLPDAQNDLQQRATLDASIHLLTLLRIDFELEYGSQSQETIYPDLASAQSALDRGESVRIALAPIAIDPALVRIAQELQDKERLQEWLNHA